MEHGKGIENAKKIICFLQNTIQPNLTLKTLKTVTFNGLGHVLN